MRPGIAPVVTTVDYTIGIEDVGGLSFAHVTVFSRFTVPIARAIRADFDGILVRQGPPLFAIAMEPRGGDHMKLDSFVRWMRFQYHSIERINGIARVCYVRWR